MKYFLSFILLLSYKMVLAQTVSGTIARVSGIEGNSFVFYGPKNTATLKYGDKVYNYAEIMVEDEGFITLYDDHGHTYHLAGGTHIKFNENKLEVKNGKVWVKSVNSQHPFVMNSVNSSADYKQGQFVFSFSNVDGKTQLLVLEGKVSFSNILEPNLGTEVDAGYFSLIDNDYNQGLPRTATRVGLNSYKQTKQAFYGIEEIENSDFESMLGEAKRSVASVGSPVDSPMPNTSGKLYFISSAGNTSLARLPASVGKGGKGHIGPADYYKQKLKAQKQMRRSANANKDNILQIRFFGWPDNKLSAGTTVNTVTDAARLEGARTPASIKTEHIVKDLNNAFEKSLKQKIKIDKRHPEEVNQLIDELKSYDQNFSKNY